MSKKKKTLSDDEKRDKIDKLLKENDITLDEISDLYFLELYNSNGGELIRYRYLRDIYLLSNDIRCIGVANFVESHLDTNIYTELIKYIFETCMGDMNNIYFKEMNRNTYYNIIRRIVEENIEDLIFNGYMTESDIYNYIITNLNNEKIDNLYKIMEVIPKDRVLLEDI